MAPLVLVLRRGALRRATSSFTATCSFTATRDLAVKLCRFHTVVCCVVDFTPWLHSKGSGPRGSACAGPGGAKGSFLHSSTRDLAVKLLYSAPPGGGPAVAGGPSGRLSTKKIKNASLAHGAVLGETSQTVLDSVFGWVDVG